MFLKQALHDHYNMTTQRESCTEAYYTAFKVSLQQQQQLINNAAKVRQIGNLHPGP